MERQSTNILHHWNQRMYPLTLGPVSLSITTSLSHKTQHGYLQNSHQNATTTRYHLAVTKKSHIHLNIKTLHPLLISHQTSYDERLHTLILDGENNTYTVIIVLYAYQRCFSPKNILSYNKHNQYHQAANTVLHS